MSPFLSGIIYLEFLSIYIYIILAYIYTMRIQVLAYLTAF